MAHTSRACEAEPSDALRDQTDPLEPAGRRFANFFLVLFRFGANAGARAFGTERWRDRRERSEVRGLRQQPARNRTDTGVTENPYRLARDIRGIGFKTADAIAMKLGIEKTAMVRVRAGISYALTEA
jgi:hypothetical protein